MNFFQRLMRPKLLPEITPMALSCWSQLDSAKTRWGFIEVQIEGGDKAFLNKLWHLPITQIKLTYHSRLEEGASSVAIWKAENCPDNPLCASRAKHLAKFPLRYSWQRLRLTCRLPSESEAAYLSLTQTYQELLRLASYHGVEVFTLAQTKPLSLDEAKEANVGGPIQELTEPVSSYERDEAGGYLDIPLAGGYAPDFSRLFGALRTQAAPGWTISVWLENPSKAGEAFSVECSVGFAAGEASQRIARRVVPLNKCRHLTKTRVQDYPWIFSDLKDTALALGPGVPLWDRQIGLTAFNPDEGGLGRNVLIVGGPRSGKHFFSNEMVLNQLIRGQTVHVLTCGPHEKALASYANAQTMNLAKNYGFDCLQLITSEENLHYHLSELINWVYLLSKESPSERGYALLEQALLDTWQLHQGVSLLQLQAALQRMEDGTAQTLAQALTPCCVSPYFATPPLLPTSAFVVYDFSELCNNSEVDVSLLGMTVLTALNISELPLNRIVVESAQLLENGPLLDRPLRRARMRGRGITCVVNASSAEAILSPELLANFNYLCLFETGENESLIELLEGNWVDLKAQTGRTMLLPGFSCSFILASDIAGPSWVILAVDPASQKILHTSSEA